jgi:lysophospholipase L1-like esterase
LDVTATRGFGLKGGPPGSKIVPGIEQGLCNQQGIPGWLTACACPAGSHYDRQRVELWSKEHLIPAIRSIGRPRRLGSLAGNLALSLGVFAVLFAASELVLRFYYTPENLGTVFRFDKTLGWALKPNTYLRAVDYNRNLDYIIEINSLGLREREIPMSKKGRGRRILFLGDSVTFGTGVAAEWRYSDFLQRAMGSDDEVLNAGVAGWGNDQELLYFELKGWRLEPDVVVIQLTMANDVLNNMLDHLYLATAPKPFFVFDGDSLVLVNTDFEAPVVPGRALLRDFLKKSRLLLFVKRRLDRMKYGRVVRSSIEPLQRGFTKKSLEQNYSNWSVYQQTYGEEFEDGWQVTQAILRRLADRCERMGAELIVFGFPLRIEVDDDWREDLIRRAGIDGEQLDMRRPYDRLAEFCREQDIPLLYPLQEFKDGLKQRYLYVKRDNHPNPYGHALAARILAEELNRRYNMQFHFADVELHGFDALH